MSKKTMTSVAAAFLVAGTVVGLASTPANATTPAPSAAGSTLAHPNTLPQPGPGCSTGTHVYPGPSGGIMYAGPHTTFTFENCTNHTKWITASCVSIFDPLLIPQSCGFAYFKIGAFGSTSWTSGRTKMVKSFTWHSSSPV